MSNEEMQRLERLEKVVEEHLQMDTQLVSSQRAERRELDVKISRLTEKLFGNGTKKGSIEDRLATTEHILTKVRNSQWTKQDQRMFEDDLKVQMKRQTKELAEKVDSLKKQLRLPWVILTNLIVSGGAIAAIITWLFGGLHIVH